MPKVPRFEWDDAMDPESEEYSPREGEIEEDLQVMSHITQELQYIESQIAGVDPHTGEKTHYIEDPDDTWNRLIYLREEVLSQVKDPENREAAEEGISKTEREVYKQYIPFIESRLDHFGWQNSPIEERKPRYQIHPRDIELNFELARSIIDQFGLSEEDGIEFSSELDRLQEKFERYQTEPVLFTFERKEEELQKEISEIATNRFNSRFVNESAGALGGGAAIADNLQALEKLLKEAQALQDIAVGMSDETIKSICEERAQSLHDFIEQLKTELEISPELLRIRGQLRDLLQRIKSTEAVNEEELSDIEGRLSEIAGKKSGDQSREIIDQLERLLDTAGKAFRGEPYDEFDERFETGTDQVDWAWTILGIERDASDSDIKKAYKEMAMKYHPDRNKNEDAKEKMQKINEAYEFVKRVRGFK